MMDTHFDAGKIIQCMTSLALVQAGDSEKFWEVAIARLNKEMVFDETIDAFLKMNLLWVIGRNFEGLSIPLKEELI